MPVYEYVCPRCGSAHERLRKYEERQAASDCPGCGAPAEAVLSAAAVRGGSGEAGPARPGPAAHACCGGGRCGH